MILERWSAADVREALARDGEVRLRLPVARNAYRAKGDDSTARATIYTAARKLGGRATTTREPGGIIHGEVYDWVEA